MKRIRTKRILIVLLTIAAVTAISIGCFYAYSAYQMSRVHGMTFDEMLAYTTRNNGKAVITVGIIQNGEKSYTVYGENGIQLAPDEYIYEIGSLTKTFTASLLFKAVSEGLVSLDDSIDMYLDLPEKGYYPTLKRLITHTSGYKSHYFEAPMIANFLFGRNDFYEIPNARVIGRIGKIDLQDRDYDFVYSNFGIAVIGLVLAEIYNDDYKTVINEYIAAEMELHSTRIADGSGDLGNYWNWREDDAYMPAGALISTIGDMLKYAELQLTGHQEYISRTHEILAEISATSPAYAEMNIRMDSIGAAWMIDDVNNIVWHNGGTDDYNCYLGFGMDRQTAVVILSNLPPDYRIPATMMGARLLTDLISN